MNNIYYPKTQGEIQAVESHFLGLGALAAGGLKIGSAIGSKIKESRAAKGKGPLLGGIVNKIRENRAAKGKAPIFSGGMLQNAQAQLQTPNRSVDIQISDEDAAEMAEIEAAEKKKKTMIYAAIGVVVLALVVFVVIKMRK